MSVRYLRYIGGSGIRIYPRAVMASTGYRPADEDREWACDTSILTNLRALNPNLRIDHRDIDPRQIVDWKSHAEQLNDYAALRVHRGQELGDPFEALEDVFPYSALSEMRAHYEAAMSLAVA